VLEWFNCFLNVSSLKVPAKPSTILEISSAILEKEAQLAIPVV